VTILGPTLTGHGGRKPTTVWQGSRLLSRFVVQVSRTCAAPIAGLIPPAPTTAPPAATCSTLAPAPSLRDRTSSASLRSPSSLPGLLTAPSLARVAPTTPTLRKRLWVRSARSRPAHLRKFPKKWHFWKNFQRISVKVSLEVVPEKMSPWCSSSLTSVTLAVGTRSSGCPQAGTSAVPRHRRPEAGHVHERLRRT
jgi:hypothetical protein